MEPKLDRSSGSPAPCQMAADDEFTLELTLEQLSHVAGGAIPDDESPKR